MSANVSPELLVHIGLPKTGTTAIQQYMYARRTAYAQQGIYWAETYPTDSELNDCAHHIYSHKWGGWLTPSDFPITPEEAWQALRKSIEAKGGRHIISSERFADLLPLSDGEDVINFFREIAGTARVRVIGYVRRQDDLIESHIRELIKGSVSAIDMNEYWRTLVASASFAYLDEGFSKAVKLLGKENVIIRIYDRERLVGGDSVTDFLHACDLPTINEGPKPDERANPSLNTLACKLLSDQRIVGQFDFAGAEVHFIRNFFSQANFDRFNEYKLLDSEKRRQVMESFQAGNEHLVEMFSPEIDADALRIHENETKRGITDNQLILTYEELVSLLVGMRSDFT